MKRTLIVTRHLHILPSYNCRLRHTTTVRNTTIMNHNPLLLQLEPPSTGAATGSTCPPQPSLGRSMVHEQLGISFKLSKSEGLKRGRYAGGKNNSELSMSPLALHSAPCSSGSDGGLFSRKPYCREVIQWNSFDATLIATVSETGSTTVSTATEVSL